MSIRASARLDESATIPAQAEPISLGWQSAEHPSIVYFGVLADQRTSPAKGLTSNPYVEQFNTLKGVIRFCSNRVVDLVVVNTLEIAEYGPIAVSSIKRCLGEDSAAMIFAIGPHQFPELAKQLKRAGADLTSDHLPDDLEKTLRFMRGPAPLFAPVSEGNRAIEALR